MTLKLRDGVFTAETEYGITLLDEDRDQYWTLNPSAAVALRTLLDDGTVAEAAQALTEQYAVDIDSAHQDVRELVGELRSAGLVKEKKEENEASRAGPSVRPARHRVRRWRPEKKTP
ncbi:lasso peptide biosynthesis PqqD family chaperone [Streptomyces albicerus]|uniref:lasso peptide biosynthesis PqqD family chaperone n=1 Tax=Streptomyces albicerus TaxID=2569859 RepID=UPI00124B5DEE|nr:lasso peptide biosynthesis PqqD family chaperone [Streptomyces albicerus]